MAKCKTSSSKMPKEDSRADKAMDKKYGGREMKQERKEYRGKK